MKLIYQGFKITPELRNRAKFLAVKNGVNFSEWLCKAVLSQVEKEEKENGFAMAVAEKIDRDRKKAAQTLSNNCAIAKGVQNENKKSETNEV